MKRVPKIRAETMLTELDGTFPNHEANPLKVENLDPLRELVKRSKAEVGVSFDGDADRCCFVDETGRTVPADLMTALLAPGFAARGACAPASRVRRPRRARARARACARASERAREREREPPCAFACARDGRAQARALQRAGACSAA